MAGTHGSDPISCGEPTPEPDASGLPSSDGQVEDGDEHPGRDDDQDREHDHRGEAAERHATAAAVPAAPHVASPAMKDSRTVRVGLSPFGSRRQIDCHVPRARRPPTTGTVSDGDASSGSRWSAP